MSYTINTTYKAKYYGSQRAVNKIKYIVIHYTANNGTTASAKSNANYFANITTTKASAHYVVDESSIIYQCVPDNYIAWSVGDNQKYTNGGATMKNIITNTNSMSIEMVSHSDLNGKYYIPDKTIQNTIELIQDLQKKYNISDSNLYRHYDVTGKLCPKPFVDDISLWDNFKKLISGLKNHSDNYYKVQSKYGFDDNTMSYLEAYQYADSLFMLMLQEDKNEQKYQLNTVLYILGYQYGKEVFEKLNK